MSFNPIGILKPLVFKNKVSERLQREIGLGWSNFCGVKSRMKNDDEFA